MKLIILLLLTLGILVFLTTSALAQPGLPGPPTQAPIDGGLGILATAGGVYAWKKLKRNKQECEE